MVYGGKLSKKELKKLEEDYNKKNKKGFLRKAYDKVTGQSDFTRSVAKKAARTAKLEGDAEYERAFTKRKIKEARRAARVRAGVVRPQQASRRGVNNTDSLFGDGGLSSDFLTSGSSRRRRDNGGLWESDLSSDFLTSGSSKRRKRRGGGLFD